MNPQDITLGRDKVYIVRRPPAHPLTMAGLMWGDIKRPEEITVFLTGRGGEFVATEEDGRPMRDSSRKIISYWSDDCYTTECVDITPEGEVFTIRSGIGPVLPEAVVGLASQQPAFPEEERDQHNRMRREQKVVGKRIYRELVAPLLSQERLKWEAEAYPLGYAEAFLNTYHKPTPGSPQGEEAIFGVDVVSYLMLQHLPAREWEQAIVTLADAYLEKKGVTVTQRQKAEAWNANRKGHSLSVGVTVAEDLFLR